MQYPHNSDPLRRGSVPPGSPWRGHQAPIDGHSASQNNLPNLGSGSNLKLSSLPKLGSHIQQSNINTRGPAEQSFAHATQGPTHLGSNSIPVTPSSGKPFNSRSTPKYNKMDANQDTRNQSPYGQGENGISNSRDTGAHILGSVNAQMMPKVNTSYGMSSLNTVLPGMSNTAGRPNLSSNSGKQQVTNNSVSGGSEYTPKVEGLSIQDKPVPNTATPQQNSRQEMEKFGLRSLLDSMENMSKEKQNVVLGSDMSQSGLNLRNNSEKLSHSFASPWQETSKHPVIPDFKLPACYSIDTVVPQQQKLQNFDEGALFYIFYTMPRDAMQEAAAVELTNRSWRYHKELKMWLTKDPMSEPIQTNNQEESGIYIFFDPTSWKKIKREYILYYPDIA